MHGQAVLDALSGAQALSGGADQVGEDQVALVEIGGMLVAVGDPDAQVLDAVPARELSAQLAMLAGRVRGHLQVVSRGEGQPAAVVGQCPVTRAVVPDPLLDI